MSSASPHQPSPRTVPRGTRRRKGAPLNPWLDPTTNGSGDTDIAPPTPVVALVDRAGPAAPQPGIAAPDRDGRLPQRPVTSNDRDVTIWWAGVHGGAGETTLERCVPDTKATGHTWPTAPPRDDTPPPRVVLVARTSHHGLTAAQRALRDWAAGGIPVELAGLVLIPDAPGSLPKPLRELAALVAGGAPHTWRLAWSAECRLGHDPATNPPKGIRRLLNDLNPKEHP